MRLIYLKSSFINYKGYIQTTPSSVDVSMAKAWIRNISNRDYPLYIPVNSGHQMVRNEQGSGIGNSTEDKKITVYPNPANNLVFLTGDFDPISNITFELYDLSGRLVLAHTFLGNNKIQSINVNQISTGSYIYKVKVEGEELSSERLIIVK